MSSSPSAPSDPLEQLLTRPGSPMGATEWRVEVAAGVAFLAGTLALLAVFGTSGAPLGVESAAAVLLVAFAMNVRFDVGAGYTVPTQVAFVPLLFSAPPALVPALTAVAVLLGSLPSALRGSLRLSRLLTAIPNSWFALGAATVVAVLGPAVSAADRPWVLAAAFAGQVVADFVASLLRDLALGRATLREELAEAPWVYGVDAALTPAGLLATWAPGGALAGLVCLVPLLGLLLFFARERRARMEGLVELNRAYRGTALVLGDVIEGDDSYTGEHSRGVVTLTLDVAERLGLDAAQTRNLEFAALLHDVGKVAISKDIINKPGRLDADEWRVVKTHTVEGQRMLDQIGGFMHQVGAIVRSHHEHWDGGGYPDGLAGAAIPIEARVISCCDAFNAMTTTRSYREAMPLDDAIAELERNAGTQFDPAVVAAVLASVAPRRRPRAMALGHA